MPIVANRWSSSIASHITHTRIEAQQDADNKNIQEFSLKNQSFWLLQWQRGTFPSRRCWSSPIGFHRCRHCCGMTKSERPKLWFRRMSQVTAIWKPSQRAAGPLLFRWFHPRDDPVLTRVTANDAWGDQATRINLAHFSARHMCYSC